MASFNSQTQLIEHDIPEAAKNSSSFLSARKWGGMPRRDFILLPLISLFTLATLLAASEVAARHFFYEQNVDSCVVKDPSLGFKYRPNCTSRVKAAEGPWIVDHFNDCGYRSDRSCKSKPAGTTRIALIGSSTSEGYFVPYNEAFFTRMERQLTALCHRPVEVQNLGRAQCFPDCSFRRVDEALALKPDILMLSISPHDIEGLQSDNVANRDKPIPMQEAEDPPDTTSNPIRRLQRIVRRSRAFYVAEYFLFQDPASYLRLYLINRENVASLSDSFSPAWERHFKDLDLLIGEMAAKAHAANVPFVMVEVPSLAQASVLSMNNPPPALDPNAINARLQQIADRHGIEFVDVLSAFKETPHSNKLFYQVDGHLDGEGQALISGPIVDQLTSGSDPVFKGCERPAPSTAARRLPPQRRSGDSANQSLFAVLD
jgi:hypothetical protein